MPIEFKNIHVSSSGQAVVVTGIIDSKLTFPPSSGEVSATEYMPGVWYVNRAIIGPTASRGKGLGTQLMKRLLAEVSGRAGFKYIIVEPGGYSSDLARQARFYANNGFVAVPDKHNLYRWTKENDVAKTA